MASLQKMVQLKYAQDEMGANKTRVMSESLVGRKVIPDEWSGSLNCVQILVVVVVVLYVYLSERNGLNPMRPRSN
jgi:hypothetical protein